MDNNFFAYLQQLEMLGFFSGYPLIYAVIVSIAGKQLKNNFKSRSASLLPFAYALVGTLFLGLQLKNLYPDYSGENIKTTFQHPYLLSWALLSILFWIPALSKKKKLSLLHSLIFFLVLAKDLFLQIFTSSAYKDIAGNGMKVYTLSLLLNLVAFVLIALLSFLLNRYKKV